MYFQDDAHTLMELIPTVKRARRWRLYADGGRRFVDLWQNGGRTLLGAKPDSLVRELKSAADRALFAALPSHHGKRLEAALSMLFPSRVFRFYERKLPFRVPLWRPFSAEAGNKTLAEPLFSPVLPFPLVPEVLVLKSERDAAALPPQEVISPVLLVCAVRAVYAIMKGDRRGAIRYQTIERIPFEKTLWRKDGIYLYYTGSGYMEDFSRFLSKGFLLSPDSGEPLILPGELSCGEEKSLASLIFPAQ
ncbi:MAG: hypothetical protein LBC77_06320 [Spirochaetaceae bacterium]|jgi:hypothetical protein|nr:hypothetical protein [Spirochaetaceae bacterium]